MKADTIEIAIEEVVEDEHEPLGHHANAEHEAAWIAEVKERRASYLRGEEPTVTAEEMFARARKRIDDFEKSRR